MTDAVVAESVVKAFGGVSALNGLDIRVASNAIHGVIGPNGSGKSTLMNALSGFTRVDAGRVVIKGHEVTKTAPHRVARLGVARSFQTVRLVDRLTVRENVLFGLGRGRRRARAVGARTRERACDRILELTGVAHLASRPVSSVASVGDQRFVELARLLATAPDVVLLDEPAAGMDPVEAERLAGLVQLMHDQGRTVVIVEHELELVFRLCTRISVLDFGACIATGTPEEIKHDPKVVDAYLGGDDE